ncbi:MAG: hypothetical protein M3R27_09845 [Bacteroidota bacterium]|nr:hypothetical protein [Bacteroidota bacterium]
MSFICLVIFYTLWLISRYVSTFDPELTSFPGRMIGEATLDGYDIGKRLSLFYRSGFIFIASLSVFSFGIWRLSRLSIQILTSSEFKILNYSSLAGITFFFFELWTPGFSDSFELIYCLHKIVIVGFLLKFILLKNKKEKDLLNISFYTISLVLGVGVFFLIKEFSMTANSSFVPELFSVVGITVLLLLIAFCLLMKQGKEMKHRLNVWAYVLVPFSLIPLFSFLNIELYLILNRNQVYWLTPGIIYVIMLLAAFSFSAYRYRKYKKVGRQKELQRKDLIGKYYLPLFIIGISAFTLYEPFIHVSSEMFEAGNRYLPIMEFQKFGVIPILEKFNSHVLSDIFFPAVYTFFNGLQGREIFLYDFIYHVIGALLVYHLMYRISGNAFIALFVVFLFPLTESLLSAYAIIAVIAIYSLHKVLQSPPDFKKYLGLATCLAFLLLWRIDIGVPALTASIVILLIYRFGSDDFRIDWKILLKTLLVLCIVILSAILLISLNRDMNIFEKLWSGFNYLTSAQTYGYTAYGNAADSVFKIQYFIFPLIALLLGLTLVVSFRNHTLTKSRSFLHVAFLFLIIYYLSNFQRGLVRHSFLEGHDNALSTFVFFVLSGSVFIFLRKRTMIVRFSAFLVLSVILVMNYKFPVVKEFNNLFSLTMVKARSQEPLILQPGIVRTIDSENFEESNYGSFKRLISSQLSEVQTFHDFSNMPMLYYFTGKVSPSYFYQNPLTIHNEYLQKSFISETEKYDAPFLIFSHFPENWSDNVDAVPNTMRHYRMAEFFYQTYSPFVISDSLCIWKRKDFNAANVERNIFTYSAKKDTNKASQQFIRNIHPVKEKHYVMEIVYQENVPSVTLVDHKISNKLVPSNIDLNSRIAYYIISDKQEDFSICVNADSDLISAKMTEHDYIPDFYSRLPQWDDLHKLPYIWAAYDDSVRTEQEIVSLVNSAVVLKKDLQFFNFNESIDKRSGNTVMISMDVMNEKELQAELLYGSKSKGFQGGFKFLIPPGSGTRDFAVRVSSQYNWYDPTVNYLALMMKGEEAVTLSSLRILKSK